MRDKAQKAHIINTILFVILPTCLFCIHHSWGFLLFQFSRSSVVSLIIMLHFDRCIFSLFSKTMIIWMYGLPTSALAMTAGGANLVTMR